MITVEEASKIIQSKIRSFGVEHVSLMEAHGRTLKETICADQDFPPFNRVCMDGIAVSASSFEKGLRTFTIEGIQAAGSPQLVKKGIDSCIEVMTGAVLPEGADVVIPYEQVDLENGKATVSITSVKHMQNVHLKGKDKKKGDVLINEDTQITAAEIGVLATVGKSAIKVAKQPTVVIISTGDELVEVHEIPLAHQIRRSNVYSLQSLLLALGITAETRHIGDDKSSLSNEIESCFEQYDVLLFSGAVSKGKFDFIPEVLDNLGVKKLFHKVKQRPGKPFWFGELQAANGGRQATVFAFPGNPVSTYVNCLQYFYPWYKASIGVEVKKEYAVLNEDISFKPQMTYFLQVKLEQNQGEIEAAPVTGNGSGDLANLVKADAFLILPMEQTEFKKGNVFPILRYRSF